MQQFSISGIVKKFKHLPAKSQGFFQTTRLRLTASPRQAEDRRQKTDFRLRNWECGMRNEIRGARHRAHGLSRQAENNCYHGTTRKNTETANIKYVDKLFSIRVIP